MPQVVDAANLLEFTKTGKVPEFKPPVTEPPKSEPEQAAAPAKDPTKEAPKQEAVRNDKGQFTKPPEGDKTAATAATAEQEKHEGGDDLSEADLPEKVRKVIGKKHRAMKEAEEREQLALRRANQAELRAAEVERKLRDQKSGPAQTEEAKPPKAEDFASVAEYADALVDFKLKQREIEERKQREADEKAVRERTFVSRMRDYQAANADFQDALKTLEGSDLDQVPRDMTEFIQESEVGPALLHHLAKHPSTLDRIRNLPSRRMFVELGRLEDQLSRPVDTPKPKESEPEPPAKAKTETQVSRAPAPIAPLDTAGIAPVAKKPEDMSPAELREFRRQEQLEKRAAGRH